MACILDFYSRDTVSLKEENAFRKREEGLGNLFPPCTHFKRIRFSWESSISRTFYSRDTVSLKKRKNAFGERAREDKTQPNSLFLAMALILDFYRFKTVVRSKTITYYSRVLH
jgi:hypothetical protein